ncbi:MAG: hypothetical protein H6735_27420 [Alphaproteobacteria bacterium]|nr:hypothetical protein [Alphaproteobacteria bacterium]
MPLVLMSCGAKYKPTGPVIGDYERAFQFPVNRPHEGLSYTGRAPATEAPVLPFMVFGAAFDLDFVVMPRNGDFDMLEYARIAAPKGPMWLALETSADSGDQTILANVDDIDTFMPELPLRRQSVNLQVDDRCTEFTVDVSLSYTSSNGERVEAEMVGDPPLRTQSKRNGKTFDHSQNQLMAVLDIPASHSLFKANVQADGKGVGFRKIGGIVPGQFVLNQVQGGIASGRYVLASTEPAAGGASFGEVVLHTPDAAPSEAEAAKPAPDMLVRMGVAKNFPKVLGCWRTRLAEQADLPGGSSRYSWTLTGGKVSEAALANPAGEERFADEGLTTCVTEAMGGWAFDASVNGTVWWDFTFEVPPAPAEGEEPVEAGVQINEGEFTEAAGAMEEAPPMEAPAEGGTTVKRPAGEDELPDDMSDVMGEEPAADAPAPEAKLSSFTTTHLMPNGNRVEQQWLVSRQGDRVIARQTSELRSITYNYRLVSEAFLELVSITVEQYGRATPVTAVTFNPPIPDVRWPFNGRRSSSFVIDVNGQENYAVGTAEAFWTESGPRVKVTASDPEWAAARPMLAKIGFPGDGTAEIVVERTGE